jgi:hypothetical protein
LRRGLIELEVEGGEEEEEEEEGREEEEEREEEQGEEGCLRELGPGRRASCSKWQ